MPFTSVLQFCASGQVAISKWIDMQKEKRIGMRHGSHGAWRMAQIFGYGLFSTALCPPVHVPSSSLFCFRAWHLVLVSLKIQSLAIRYLA